MMISRMPLLVRDIKLHISDSAALMQLWLLPLLVFFIAGLVLPQQARITDVSNVVALLTLLMVALPLTARQWQAEIESGALEQIYVAQGSLLAAVTVRTLLLCAAAGAPVAVLVTAAAWLWLGIPAVLSTFLAMLLLVIFLLALSVLIGALTTGLRNAPLLVGLLLVPFLLPAGLGFMMVLSIPAALYLLAAGVVLAVPLCILAAAFVLQQQLCV